MTLPRRHARDTEKFDTAARRPSPYRPLRLHRPGRRHRDPRARHAIGRDQPRRALAGHEHGARELEEPGLERGDTAPLALAQAGLVGERVMHEGDELQALRLTLEAVGKAEECES